MSISKKDVEHIAHLARINLTEEEKERFWNDLNKVLGYVEVLKTVDTEGILPMNQVTGLENAFREDESYASPHAGEIIKRAPQSEGRFIKVKKVFNE